MSFWSKVKRALSAGGIKVRMDVPPAFRWSDESLPVALELRNATEEPRTVKAFRIAILPQEADDDRSSKSISVGSGTPPARRGGPPDDTNEMGGFRYRTESPLTIGPGETLHTTIEVPLSAQQIGLELGDAAPDWLGKASKMFDQARDLTAKEPHYYVFLRTEVEGYSGTSVLNRPIRHLKPDEKMTSWSSKFGKIDHD